MSNEDFVSRQWLIDEYHRRHQGAPGGALKMIEEAPAADVEPKQRWIPVTERLPEVGEDVLLYAVGKSDDFSSVIAITDRIIFRLFSSSEGVEKGWKRGVLRGSTS